MLNGTALITDLEASAQSASPDASNSATTRAGLRRRPEQPKVRRAGGLVLTRHLGESIMIGEEVEIQVVGLQGGKVRIKVIAPREIAVHRREIFDAIRAGDEPARPSAAPSTSDLA
jgi:carbon storage regulator